MFLRGPDTGAEPLKTRPGVRANYPPLLILPALALVSSLSGVPGFTSSPQSHCVTARPDGLFSTGSDTDEAPIRQMRASLIKGDFKPRQQASRFKLPLNRLLFLNILGRTSHRLPCIRDVPASALHCLAGRQNAHEEQENE